MKKRLVDLGGQSALPVIASYGPAAPRSLKPAQRAYLESLNGVGAHLTHIDREDFEVETDMGERIDGRGRAQALTASGPKADNKTALEVERAAS